MPLPIPEPRVLDLQRRAAALSSTSSSQDAGEETPGSSEYQDETEPGFAENSAPSADSERVRAMANWDPSYRDEKVDWYGEYIARHGPIAMSWLQQPRIKGSDFEDTHEIRGIGLYQDSTGSKIVAPLEDGSVCLWQVGYEQDGNTPSSFRRGAVHARSRPNLLSVCHEQSTMGQEPPTSRAKMTSTGVVECVSVDNFRNKAYFAVQSGLNEVDLNTLQISQHQRFPHSISALSDTTYPTPLTVGTTLSLHLHDPRRSTDVCWSDPTCTDRVDTVANFPASRRYRNDFYRLLSSDQPSEYASLFHPGPLAIHHISPSGKPSSNNGEIYVAGRFPSLLIYDRRTFPKLRNTIHSGARLCSLTSLPYTYKALEVDLMRQNLLSAQSAREVKSDPGKTLVAAGEYNGKGSLEVYGLSSGESLMPPPQAGGSQNSTYKNRVSASRSKLLSVAAHGTRLVVSDGDGQLRWIERDGSTLVRRWNINAYPPDTASVSNMFTSSSFFSSSSSALEPCLGDVARKLIPMNGNTDGKHVDRDELLVWTGEKIGVLSFKEKPLFGVEEWEERVESLEEKVRRREERIYGQTMRRALERQADEVRFVRGLGVEAMRFGS